METHPTLLGQSARYRQEELRGLGGRRPRALPRPRLPRVRRQPRLRFVFAFTSRPSPASGR
ncbi:MAG TPA: hypothetical protein VLX59_20125 [Acidimicrobiales bacterium]|nr:hypothetical protein [Acidimicrobiales bacterium]